METEQSIVPIQLPLSYCLDILKNMGMVYVPKDIKNPTVENLNHIYKAFLSECLSIRQDSYEKDNLDDAIIHFNEDIVKNQAESFKLLRFFIAM
jgi:hypothetical protein